MSWKSITLFVISLCAVSVVAAHAASPSVDATSQSGTVVENASDLNSVIARRGGHGPGPAGPGPKPMKKCNGPGCARTVDGSDGDDSEADADEANGCPQCVGEGCPVCPASE